MCPPILGLDVGSLSLENLFVEPPTSEQEGTVRIPEARGGADRGGGRVYM